MKAENYRISSRVFTQTKKARPFRREGTAFQTRRHGLSDEFFPESSILDWRKQRLRSKEKKYIRSI